MPSPIAALGRTDPLVAFLATLVIAFLAVAPVVQAAGRGEPGEIFEARIDLPDADSDLFRLKEMDIDVDGVFEGWARVHLLAEELETLRGLGYSVTVLPPEKYLGMHLPPPGEGPLETAEVPAEYHTYESLTSELQAIAASHPEITRLTTIGQSVQGRELWMMKISDNAGLDEDEPEAAYISSMHGDEVVGKEMCVNLINYLVDNYGTDSRVTDLVDATEIWIMPSMNPDGTASAQRYNANNVDLNRDFPDYYSDPVNTPDGRQPETKAVMEWTLTRSLNLAANLHGGALVVNYPFDNNPSGTATFSPAPDPDHPAFVSISRSYADNNSSIFNSATFPGGITNGAEWYVVNGGMQDWAYAWYGIFEVTLEISASDWPSAAELPQFWAGNQESMLSYLERVQDGVRGVVTDSVSGAPLAATILLDADPFPTLTDPVLGDYHRIVLPGSYTMTVSAEGYGSQTIPISVVASAAARYDVSLQLLPSDLQPVGHRVMDGSGGDGSLDPGETAELAVTVRNLGLPATQVGARLVPTGWFAEVSRPTADYPDLGTGVEAESDSPHYEISLDPAVPSGHKIGFALQWTSTEDSGTSEPFFVDAGVPPCETYDAADLPQAILDATTTTSDLVVAADRQIDELQVTVDITHTYIGDLTLTLASPTGTAVALHSRSGAGANNIVGTYPLDLTPAESLDLLAGESATGTWQLAAHDHANQDTGTFNAWSLTLCESPPVEATTPEMRLRELRRDAEGVHLGWWSYPGLDSYRVYRSSDPSSAAAFVDVTSMDGDDTDTSFLDTSSASLLFYLVTGVGPQGEGPKGHFGE